MVTQNVFLVFAVITVSSSYITCGNDAGVPVGDTGTSLLTLRIKHLASLLGEQQKKDVSQIFDQRYQTFLRSRRGDDEGESEKTSRIRRDKRYSKRIHHHSDSLNKSHIESFTDDFLSSLHLEKIAPSSTKKQISKPLVYKDFLPHRSRNSGLSSRTSAVIPQRNSLKSSKKPKAFQYRDHEDISEIVSINKSKMFGNLNHSTTYNITNEMPDPCESSTSLRNIIFSCFLVCVLLVGLCGNTLSIVVILSSRSLQKQVAYKFIISLAVADMGVSFFVTTMELRSRLQNGNFCDSLGVCHYFTLVTFVFPMASITHLLVIAVDRFCAVVTPYRYAVLFTHSNVKFFIACTWIYVLFWAAAGMFSWDPPNHIAPMILSAGQGRFCFYENNMYVTIMSIFIYFLPTVISTCLYCVILWVAMKQANTIGRMRQQQQQIKNNDKCRGTSEEGNTKRDQNANRSLSTASPAVTTHKKQRRRLKRDLKAARTIAFVFVAYTVCWMPHFITILITIWNFSAIQRFQTNHRLAYDVIFTAFSNILPTLNSCINPFIYFLFGASFRTAFKDVLRKLLKKPRSGIYYPDDCTSHAGTPKMEENKSSTAVIVAARFSSSSSIKTISGGMATSFPLSPSTPSSSSSSSNSEVHL